MSYPEALKSLHSAPLQSPYWVVTREIWSRKECGQISGQKWQEKS